MLHKKYYIKLPDKKLKNMGLSWHVFSPLLLTITSRSLRSKFVEDTAGTGLNISPEQNIGEFPQS